EPCRRGGCARALCDGPWRPRTRQRLRVRPGRGARHTARAGAREVRLLCAAAFAASSVAGLSAQASATSAEPAVRVRPFVLATEQRFAARQTFDATFGSRTAPFFGGGVEFATRRGLFVDVTLSRMSKTGQRAFINNGEAFQLGIPLKVTVT